MKNLMFIFLLGTLASCGNELKLKDGMKMESGGSTLSGTVTTIWNNIGISSAHAQEMKMAAAKSMGGDLELVVPRKAYDLGEMHKQYSEQLLIHDFFTSAGSSEYSDLVSEALGEAASTRLKLQDMVSGTDFSKLSDSDFPHGIAMAIGFDGSKKVVSILASALNKDGSYQISDEKEEIVKFYKLAFVFVRSGELQFRQSYAFMDGKAQKLDVDFISSAASIKVTGELANDTEVAISTIQESLVKHKQSSAGSALEKEELNIAAVFLASSYSMYERLTSVQKSLVDSAMIHSMKSSSDLKKAMVDYKSALSEYYDYDGSDSLDYLTSNMVNNADPKELVAAERLSIGVRKVVDDLINASLIPSSGRMLVATQIKGLQEEGSAEVQKFRQDNQIFIGCLNIRHPV